MPQFCHSSIKISGSYDISCEIPELNYYNVANAGEVNGNWLKSIKNLAGNKQLEDSINIHYVLYAEQTGSFQVDEIVSQYS